MYTVRTLLPGATACSSSCLCHRARVQPQIGARMRALRERVAAAPTLGVVYSSGRPRTVSSASVSQAARPGTIACSTRPLFGWVPSLKVIANMAAAVDGVWVPRIRTNHARAVSRYIVFCRAERVPSQLVFPAHEAVLCAFALSQVGRCAGTTVRNALAGVKAWHTRCNVSYLDSPRLKAIVEGVDRLRPREYIRPLRPPVSISMLRHLAKIPAPLSSLDMVVQSCAHVAFWGQFRLGELLPDTIRSFSSEYHPARGSWEARTGTLVLPWTKTTRRAGARVMLHSQASRTCPRRVVRRHLASSKFPAAAPLCSYIKPDGSATALSKRVFLKRINEL